MFEEIDEALVKDVFTSAKAFGLSGEQFVEAVQHTSTVNKTPHFEALEDVCSTLGMSVRMLFLLIVEGISGGFYTKSELKDPFSEVIEVGVFFPRRMEHDALARTGFYAHEVSHACLYNHPMHREYIETNRTWIQKYQDTSLLGLLPALFWRRFKGLPLALGVDTMVDDYAASHGYCAEIEAVRKHFPLKPPRFFFKPNISFEPSVSSK